MPVKPFLVRFRWAIVLAALQGMLFAAFGLVEHRRSLPYAHRKPQIEYFGCLPLPHERLSSQERMYLSIVDCWSSHGTKFVLLANLPVFLVWGGLSELTANTDIDQARSFYVIGGLGIPALWFYLGSLIDRRRLRKLANAPSTSIS
jgi:hypothetical protein